MAIEVERVSDEVLEMAAEEKGPSSAEAKAQAPTTTVQGLAGVRLSVRQLLGYWTDTGRTDRAGHD